MPVIVTNYRTSIVQFSAIGYYEDILQKIPYPMHSYLV